MKLLVTGGCGYKGSVLVPKLLERGHYVTVLDTQWFGNYLDPNPHLQFISDDIRALPGSVFARGSLGSFDAVIHLAGIANDPCGELDAKLTWEVNALATMRLADACARSGVRRFVFASSASVYGLKDNRPVVEEDEPEPVSDYNKTKMVAERCLWSYRNAMLVQIVRPATVCGLSPRMRLDTLVNMLTAQALEKGSVTAHCGEHGGELMRPNVHIQDITDLYCFLLSYEQEGVWNAGFENLSVMQTAARIVERIPAVVQITEVKDKRSYAVNSNLLLSTGFAPRYFVADAVKEIKEAWQAGKLRRDERSVNLEWMRKLGVVNG